MKKIQKENSIYFAICIIAVYICITAVYTTNIKKVLVSQVSTCIEETGRVCEENIEKQIKDKTSMLENVVANSKEENILDEEILEKQIKSGSFLNFGFVDTEGNGKDIKDRAVNLKGNIILEKAIKGETCVADSLDISDERKLSVIISVPVYKNNKVIGAIFGEYDFKNTVNQFNTEKTKIAILNQKNTIIMHTYKDRVGKNILSDMGRDNKGIKYEVFKSKLNFPDGKTFEIKDSKEPSYMCIRKAGINNWMFVISASKKMAFYQSKKVLWMTGAYTVMVLAAFVAIISYIISERKKNSKIIDKLAYQDQTTGIANIHKFEIEAKKILKENSKKNSVLFALDVDNFGVINDTFGYDFGDIILKIIGTSLKDTYKEIGEVARLNNDCFVGVFKLRTAGMEKEIEKTLEEFKEEVKTRIMELNINLNLVYSVGIVKIEKNMDKIDIMDLINCANMARITVKGKHNEEFAYYGENIKEALRTEKEIINDLISAVREKQFKIHYQPKIDIKTEKIVGAEALIRWIHPTKGLIRPDKFIFIAEKTKDIVKIDRFVFEEVCKTINTWKREKKTMVPVSINVSKIELYEPDYIEFIEKTLKKYDMDTKYLELEITESLALGDIDFIIKLVKKIRKMGLKISMDDFGTGYSSLSCLKSLPLDYIKLDRSFVLDIETNKDSQNVIKAMVNLAQSLNIKVVCEGVETEGQLEILKTSGCNIIQGFVYYRPLPKEEFEKRLAIENIVTDLIKDKEN
ncbi:MAG: GGDEF domain-containing protein [Clostridia bacterium]